MKINSKSVILKNNLPISLRSASPEDAEKLLKHLRITYAESYRNLNFSVDHWNKLTVSEEEKILADFENSQTKFMLCAYSGDRIVGGLGFIGYQAEFLKRSASLGMGIQKEFWNTGLGTEMMKLMLSTAKEAGFHRVDLTVRTFNAAGIKLYEKVGFQKIGLLKDAAFIDGEYVDEFSYQILLN